jgi:pantoate--beta-alanine ligase
MNIVTSISEFFELRKKMADHQIGFVHTMGNLHPGHLSLCKRSQLENDITIACIFINPTQFNSEDDFKYYPRTLSEDIALLKKHKVDYLICPNENELYADQYQVQITETALSGLLEGAYRPGHFTGMLTIVLKMLNIVRPDRAYYGEKDYQQLLLIKKMSSSLFLPTEIIGCPIIREHDGLAFSSRNRRLNAKERKLASLFPKILHSNMEIKNMIHELTESGFKVDYIADQWGRRLGAVWIDQVRLIDNVPL